MFVAKHIVDCGFAEARVKIEHPPDPEHEFAFARVDYPISSRENQQSSVIVALFPER